MKIIFSTVAILVGCVLTAAVSAQSPQPDPTDKSQLDRAGTTVMVETTLPSQPKEGTPEVAAPVASQATNPDVEPGSQANGLDETNLAINLKRDTSRDPNAPVVNFVPTIDALGEPKPKQASADSGWEFGFAPYLFAAGIKGTVGAAGRTLDLDADFSGSVWENLDLGLMGALEVKKGRFISLTDFMWVKLSNEQETPGRFYDTAKLGVNLLIIDPELGYRVVESEQGSLDVLGGVRIWSVEANLNVTSGVLPGFDVSERKTWGAPVIGVRGLVNITPKFFLTGKADIGGFGWAADLTSQLFGAVGYRVHKNVALVGGYRWLQVEYSDDEGFIYDTEMQGLMFGAKFSF